MKKLNVKKIFLLVFALCITSVVEAQFYDSADDIYYYVQYENGSFVDDGGVLVFNFDGYTAAILNNTFYDSDGDGPFFLNIPKIKEILTTYPDFFEQQVENTEYDIKYETSSTYAYDHKYRQSSWDGQKYPKVHKLRFTFSSDREYLYESDTTGNTPKNKTFKKVTKSFFKVGRSRTPSNF